MLELVPKLAKPTCLIDSIDNAALLRLISSYRLQFPNHESFLHFKFFISSEIRKLQTTHAHTDTHNVILTTTKIHISIGKLSHQKVQVF